MTSSPAPGTPQTDHKARAAAAVGGLLSALLMGFATNEPDWVSIQTYLEILAVSGVAAALNYAATWWVANRRK